MNSASVNSLPCRRHIFGQNHQNSIDEFKEFRTQCSSVHHFFVHTRLYVVNIIQYAMFVCPFRLLFLDVFVQLADGTA